jgi:osmotically-inducible protein OsmY
MIMQDIVLRDLIEEELEFEPSIDASGIGVTVENGIVTLSGHVGTYAEKLAAEQCVGRLRHVRGLAQELEVRYAEHKRIADDEIAARALKIIDWDTSIPDEAIRVVVRHGWITLTGEVDWGFEPAAAERAVLKLGGVTGVSNKITVRPHDQIPDIRRRIEEALVRDADLAASQVHVQVENGRVTLTGAVDAWHDRSVAERAAWAVPGVTDVDDRLTIV